MSSGTFGNYLFTLHWYHLYWIYHLQFLRHSLVYGIHLYASSPSQKCSESYFNNVWASLSDYFCSLISLHFLGALLNCSRLALISWYICPDRGRLLKHHRWNASVWYSVHTSCQSATCLYHFSFAILHVSPASSFYVSIWWNFVQLCFNITVAF